MNNITEDFKNAELALAAYANLSPGTPNINNLIDNGKGMSAAQAADFASKYTVIQQFNSATGASATVYEEVATGKRYVAIRGTQGVTDYLADYFIINGVPSQLNPQYVALKAQMQIWLADPQVLKGQTFTVTGHSLGGYLAAGLVADFSANISHAYLYNAPGNNSTISVLVQQLGWLTAPDASKITTLQADAGISPIAKLGNYFSTPNAVFIENQFFSGVSNPPLALNHSQQVLTDSLAVYKLLAQLAPSVTLAQLKTMFEKTSNFANRSLEAMVEALAQTITGHKPIIATDNRDALYQAINDLLAVDANGQPTGSFASLAGLVTLVNPPTSAAQARADFGAFLSLINLSPFAIKATTPEAATALQAANASLSAAWQADNALNATQRANGEANYSDLYLADRAAMLSWIAKRNKEDNTKPTLDGPDAVFRDATLDTTIRVGSVFTGDANKSQYIFGSDIGPIHADTLTGGNEDDHLYGLSGADELNGGAGNDHLEGGADADKLNGGQGTDILYGGTDDDELTGGTGLDYLYGGAGMDTYIHNSGDGNDVITDSDGQGRINVNGTSPLVGGTLKATNLWESDDKQTRYTLFNSADGSKTLNILLQNGERIFVRNWEDGQLGIHLPTSDQPTPPNPAGVTGDDDYLELAIGAARDGLSGNDVLVGNSGKEALYGGLSNDILFGNDNDDTLDGGAGNDYLNGGAGKDTISGGAGDDIIHSSINLNGVVIQKKDANGNWQSATSDNENWKLAA